MDKICGNRVGENLLKKKKGGKWRGGGGGIVPKTERGRKNVKV